VLERAGTENPAYSHRPALLATSMLSAPPSWRSCGTRSLLGADSPGCCQDTESLILDLGKFRPTIPDTVTEYYLRKSGFHTGHSSDVRV
jgi:hypothetical protein